MARTTQEPLEVYIRVRVSTAQREALVAVAAENRVNVSTLIRDAVNEYVADYSDRKVFPATPPAS